MARVQNGWVVTSAELRAQNKRRSEKRLAKAAASRPNPLDLEDHLKKLASEAEKQGKPFKMADFKKATDDYIKTWKR